MFPEMKLLEYADEIRREVCGRCTDRPRYDPRKSWLIDWIVRASQSVVGSAAHKAPRGEVQASGDGSRCEDCTRPTDFLRDLFRQAMQDADREFQEQWECLRRRLRRPAPKPGTTIRELYQAYEESTGTSLGCD